MSQPPYPAGPPQFTAPAGYGQYGTDLQRPDHPYAQGPSAPPPYPPPSYPAPHAPSPSAPPPYDQPVGLRPDAVAPMPMARQVRPQRPAVIVLAATLAVTASLQWICVLGFSWLVAVTVSAQVGTASSDGPVLHMINRFGYRMIDGLALPLFAFPLASTILGFALLSRRSWPRTALTATGVAALAWSGWWLRDSPLLWIFPAAYIVLTCGLLWTPAGSRWYRWKPGNAAF